MPNVMGYYPAPTPPAPVAPPPPPPPPAPAPIGGLGPLDAAFGVPSAPQPVNPMPAQPVQQPVQQPGAQQVAAWDTWVPTSFSDPYVAGMRTSASAVAAVSGARSAASNAAFDTYAAWKAAGARVSARAAAKSGSFFGVSSKMTKAMRMAKTPTQKAAFMSTVAKGPTHASLGSAFKYTFLDVGTIARAVASSALVAIPMALITNFLDWKAGKVTADQRNALVVADTAGYIATGTTSTLIGGAIGSTFLGPVVGTIAGIGAGFALGWVYEKYIRPRWGEWVHSAMYSNPQPVTPPPVQPPNLEPK